jgi:hypothetical protein
LNIEQVLSKKFIGKRWHIIESDYQTLQWDDESPKPTLAELEALIPIIEAETVAEKEAKKIAIAEKQAQREALFARLGITAEEVKILFS